MAWSDAGRGCHLASSPLPSNVVLLRSCTVVLCGSSWVDRKRILSWALLKLVACSRPTVLCERRPVTCLNSDSAAAVQVVYGACASVLGKHTSGRWA